MDCVEISGWFVGWGGGDLSVLDLALSGVKGTVRSERFFVKIIVFQFLFLTREILATQFVEQIIDVKSHTWHTFRCLVSKSLKALIISEK